MPIIHPLFTRINSLSTSLLLSHSVSVFIPLHLCLSLSRCLCRCLFQHLFSPSVCVFFCLVIGFLFLSVSPFFLRRLSALFVPSFPLSSLLLSLASCLLSSFLSSYLPCGIAFCLFVCRMFHFILNLFTFVLYVIINIFSVLWVCFVSSG